MENHAKTDKSATVGRQKPTSRIRKRDFRVSQGPKRQVINIAKREIVKQKFMQGEKMTQIAREEGIHRTSVAKIVKESDIATKVQELREKFYGRLEEAVDAAFAYANSPEGGRLAYEMIKDAGILRSPMEQVIEAPIEVDTEEAAIKRIATQIVVQAIEKHKAFGIPLPEAEEAEEELKNNENYKEGQSDV